MSFTLPRKIASSIVSIAVLSGIASIGPVASAAMMSEASIQLSSHKIGLAATGSPTFAANGGAPDTISSVTNAASFAVGDYVRIWDGANKSGYGLIGSISGTTVTLPYGQMNGVIADGAVSMARVADITLTALVPSAGAAGDKIKITFPAGWTLPNTADTDLKASAGNISVSYGNTITSASTPLTPGDASVSGQQLIIPVTDMNSVAGGKAVSISIGKVISPNTSATASEQILLATTTSGDVAKDSITVATATVANPDVVVTATVLPSLTFAVAGGDQTFGALPTDASTATITNANTITSSTNAMNGLSIYAWGMYGGLRSAAASHTISGVTDGNAGAPQTATEGFAITSSDGGGANTVSSTITNTALTGSAQQIASDGAVGGHRGSSVAVHVSYLAEIATTGATVTPSASDYQEVVHFEAIPTF